MSDDIWRRSDEPSRNDPTADNSTDFGSDFGTIQFADDPTSEPALSFGDDSTASNLPHWSEPATGELPLTDSAPLDDDDTDVWATFQQPSAPTRRPDRLTIGTDPTNESRRQRDVTGEFMRDSSRDITGGIPRSASGRPQPVRRAPSRGGRPGAAAMGRDMPQAITTALIMVAVFIGTIMWRPAAVMLIVIAVLGLASVEFFTKVTEKGYRPATFAGLIACVAAPLAAYWIGDGALPLVLTFAFLATSIGFLGATSVHSGPMPNVAITSMATMWIGLLGSYAALILRYSVISSVPAHTGTDTLFMVVVAVVANDVGALFVGSTAGKTPLREWVSPNKSVEGFIGGLLATIIALAIVGSQNGTWNSLKEWGLMALVVSIMAPLGDLVESMFKRNLDVKDFGSIVAGHGGVLDRFDGFLFALPSVYYLMLVLKPWS
jgi:phosphatidate cytidylyltransferase